MSMLLAIDIGNSAVKAGLFSIGDMGGTGDTRQEKALRRTGRFVLGPSATVQECMDFLREFIGRDKPANAVIASVVPEATGPVAEAALALTGGPPLVLTHETDSGLVLDIEVPESLGADRIAAAVGAVEAVGAPVAVVDFGTATTVGFVFEGEVPGQATFRGGAIMPGLALMRSSLASGTASLPEVALDGPFSALGRDTVQNILSGLVLGSAGAVERIVADVEYSEGVGFQVVLTGGMAPVVQGHMSRLSTLVEPHLALYGLRAVYERNAGGV